VWREIEATPDFWTTLSPLEPAAVPRIHEMAAEYRWEVLFVTQRPETAGETVQRQTQRWLAAHGFELPSVVVIPGSRGRAAAALRLDYLVDDNSKNCVDAISDSHGTKPFLVLREPDAVSERSARKLGIRVVRSVGECLDVLARVSVEGQDDPGILDRIAQRIGWRKPVAP
jgi:hypothetical protein